MALKKKKKRTTEKSENGSSRGGIVGRGFKYAREAKKEQELRRRRNGLYRFFLAKGEEADIRFLTEQPVTFYEHTLPSRRGNGYDNFTCLGEDCPWCERGDNPSFKGAFLIVDRRKIASKKEKGKYYQNTVRLAVFGTNVLAQLDRKQQKYGLTNREYTVARTNNAYDWEQGEVCRLKPPLEELLKDFDKKDPYDIVEDAIKPLSKSELKKIGFNKYDEDEDDDDGDEPAVSKKVRKFANL